MSHTERGRLGGLRTVALHGREHMREIAVRGGQAVVRARGREYMREIGRVGFVRWVERKFGGDRARAIEWLVKKGRAAQDPFPENGAWQ
jgi:general stress protein YciG